VATFRTLIGLVLLACAAVIAFLGFAYHGYKEDAGSTPGDTLWWAIPWAAATGVLGVLVLGALFDSERRPTWSSLGLGLALLMAFAFGALWAWA
jgi:hypothetical protein